MNPNIFLKTVQQALDAQNTIPMPLSGEELQAFYECAKKNRLLSLLYRTAAGTGVAGATGTTGIEENDEEILRKWQEEKTFYDIKECRQSILVNRLVTLSNEAGIRPVFFKGYVLADLYPEYTMRNSSDTDIYISDEERQRFVAILLDMGYERDVKLDKENVHTYRYVKNNDCWHKIELHFSLFEDFESETINILESMGLTDPNTFVQIDCCNMKMWTLGHLEHLVYQIFHMVKHYTFQGINLRYLVDISLFLKTYAKEIDRKQFWKRMEMLGYTEFCKCFLALCCQYFALDAESIGLEEKSDPALTEELLTDIYECGAKYYGQDIAHYYLIYVAYYEKLPTHARSQEPFMGDIITYDVVPKEYQENDLIRKRFELMKKLRLL